MADRSLYTVGWICAIPTELVAALAFLDEEHDPPKELDPNDYNNYQLGKISNHYVAIACLPAGEHGIAAAAGAATNLLRSFPNIRFGLMVGTGGGAPTSHHDIRLGDVVVSTPGDGKGGVFQYDFGKAMQDQALVETGFLDQPPRLLRTAVAGLKTRYETYGHTLTEEVKKALERKPRLQKTYCRPLTGDILYKSAYTHISGPREACEACDDDPSNYIPRRPRDENDDDPVIHYGLIASANQRMQNAIIRDKLAMQKGVLCFEMEAAGLMNHFPCLIIRGICDYADTHTNDKWQGYASMMAAAYARDLISRILPNQVRDSKTANEILLSLTDQVSELTYNTDKIAYKLDLAKLSIAEGAEYGSYADQHEDECLPGTRVKILHDVEEWATSLSSKCIFWLNGMAGTGKSTISRTIAKSLHTKQLLGASFFFKMGEADRGNATRFFSTIASQLQTKITGMADHLRKVIDSEPQISTKSLKEQFEKLISEPISLVKATNSQPSFLVMVIDALDECDNDKDIQILLNLIPQLQASSCIHFRVFITSRPELPIRLGFKDMEEDKYQDLILHQIPQADIEHDIRFFLNHRLEKIRKSRMLSQKWPGETNIDTLTAMSIPLFIFAATMCRVFEDHNLDPRECLDEYLKYKAEESKLDATYLPVLNRICSQYSGTRRRKAQFIQDVREVVSAITLVGPLSIASLSKLIDIPPEAIRSRLNLLHSVLNVPDDETSPIRIFHLSFRDFLLDPETRRKTSIWTDQEATNEKLFIRCFAIMRNSLKKNICNLSDFAIYRKDIADEVINQYLPIPLRYSCRYWANHLMKSHDPITQLHNVQSFLNEHLLHWTEAMSILGHFDEVVRVLKSLRRLTQGSDNSRMSEFLDDAVRDMFRIETTLIVYPLQLYISGLMFAPTTSAVRRQFSGELPDFLSMPHNIINASTGAESSHLISMRHDIDSSWNSILDERGIPNDPACLAISPNGLLLAAGFSAGIITLWNTTTRTLEEMMWAPPFEGVQALAFSSDGKLLVSCATTSGKLRFWDTTTGNLQSTVDEDVNNVTSLVFTDDDQLLASPSTAWDFLTWDNVTGIQRHTLEERLPHLGEVTLSSNGSLLASHCCSRKINLWNLGTRKLQHALIAHASPVTCTTFSTDGRLLASGDEEGTIILWDTVTGIQRQHMMKYIGSVLCITFSPGGQLLASSHENFFEDSHIIPGVETFYEDSHLRDDEIILWDLNQHRLIQKVGDQFGVTKFVLFSPDDKTLATFANDEGGCITLLDITNISRNQQPHPSYVVSVSFSFDGQLLASVCTAGRIIIWDVTSESIMQDLGERYNGNILAFSTNNTLLAFASSPRSIELWNIETRAQQCSIDAFDEVQCVAFSPDGQLVACLLDHKHIKIWDLSTNTWTQTISNSFFDQPMDSICFSPNGQYLASCGLYTLRTKYMRLIKVFRLPYSDRADDNFKFSIHDTEAYFSRDDINRIHDFPAFELWTRQGGFDRDRVSKWDYEWTNAMQSQWTIDRDWIYYQSECLIRLPDTHRAVCWASDNKTLAIGHRSGGVTFIKLTPQSDGSLPRQLSRRRRRTRKNPGLVPEGLHGAQKNRKRPRPPRHHKSSIGPRIQRRLWKRISR
ncbi:Wd40 protein [Trichoderma simmonsii]|uniref:Wd40 protein n=1 Tax=Trichoderma simmonsii TaxID=1491479 RepID=A0A8G0L4F5_9HYPO|nr:Wd40 protein [Trichoderma simmonsii]